MPDLAELLQKKLDRETLAREQAEELLEIKTDELYDTLLNVSQSETLLQSALSSMQEGFMLTDAQATILLFNKQLKNIYSEWAPSIHVGMNIKDFFYPFTQHPAYQNMIDDNQSQCSFEIKLTSGHVVAVTVNKNDKNIIASTHRDITKEKAIIAEQQKTILKLLQAQKMESIGKMASTVAHDFNNVIAAINGYASFLKEDIPQKETELLDSVNKIQQAANRAEDMVKQILSYSNHAKPTLEKTEVGLVIQESLNLIKPNLPNNIKISHSNNHNNVFTLGNISQLTQVILNIVNNSINAIGKQNGQVQINYEVVDQIDLNQPNYKIQQFMPKDAHQIVAGLHVFTEKCIRINIRDNGPGMNQNITDQLFDIFFTTRNSNKGTGLGMYGVATIITDHIGGIKVYSKKSFGTYIEIILPYLDVGFDQTHPQNRLTIDHQKQHAEILIIDDNQEVGMFLKQTLFREGYHSKYTDSPVDGLQNILLHPKRWRAIICDQKMPDIEGLELLKTIRSHGIETPFILASGYIDEYLELDEIKLASHLIAKPIDIEFLISILSPYLDRHQDHPLT